MTVPGPDRKPWRMPWNVMEAVRQQLIFAVTTFHITSIRRMPRPYPPPSGISTTTSHMASSTRHLSPKSALTRATPFYQFFISLSVPVSLSAYVPSSSGSLVVYVALSVAFSATASAFLASSSHPLICYARIPEGPPERLLFSLWTAHSISSYVGTESFTCNGLTYREIFSLVGCTWQYRPTRSAVIQSRVTQAGGGAWLTTYLYHHFIWCQDYLWRGGSSPSSLYIAHPASSILFLQYSFKFVFIARSRRRRRDLIYTGSRQVEILALMSLHASSNIQAFLLASLAFGFGICLCSYMKSPFSIVEVVRVRRWGAYFSPEVLGFFPQGGTIEAS